MSILEFCLPIIICAGFGTYLLMHGHSTSGGWLIAGAILWLVFARSGKDDDETPANKV